MNFAFVTSFTALQTLFSGTTQMDLTAVDADGIAVSGNQFSVDSTGSYILSLNFMMGAPNVGFNVTVEVFNATTAAVVATALASVPVGGPQSRVALINIDVTDVTHLFQVRLTIVNVNAPNFLSLALVGASVMSGYIRAAGSGITAGALYGSGVDGDATIAAPTTLTRNMYWRNLTVDAAVNLSTAGFAIFVQQICTINGTIRNNGAVGAAGGGAGAGAVTGSLAGGAAGGAGGAAAGSAGSAQTSALGGAGGAGGLGSGGAGGAAGAATVPTAATGGVQVMDALPNATTGQLLGTAPATLAAGAGGGGGGGGDGTAGGGGGGGGGLVMIAAGEFAGTGAIETLGGGGGSPAAGARGGGGGGGGGKINTVANGAIPAAITRSVTGGAGGTESGAGVAGTVGAVGTATHIQN